MRVDEATYSFPPSGLALGHDQQTSPFVVSVLVNVPKYEEVALNALSSLKGTSLDKPRHLFEYNLLFFDLKSGKFLHHLMWARSQGG